MEKRLFINKKNQETKKQSLSEIKSKVRRSLRNSSPVLSGRNQNSIPQAIPDASLKKQAELNYDTLFDNMIVAVVYSKMVYRAGKAVDFIHLAVNAAYGKITGLKDVVGKKMSEVIPGIWKHDRSFLDACARVAATGKSEHFEFFMPNLKSWYSITLSGAGNGLFLSIFDDITKQRESELALRTSEEKFRVLFDASPDCVSLTDISGRIIMANKKFLELFGEGLTRAIDNETGEFKIGDYVVEDDRERAISDRKEALAAGMTVPAIYKAARKDGALINIEVTRAVLRDQKGKNAGIITVTRDVTERIRQEEQIKKSEARYRLLTENIGDVVWALDNDLRYTYASPSFYASRGIKPESVIGRSIKEFSDGNGYEEMRKATSELYELALAGDSRAITPMILESRLKTAGGDYIIGEVKLHVMFDENGNPIGFNGVTRDITERRRLETGLIQAQKLEAIGQLAAGVSHEFNNLLTIMQLSAEEAMLSGTKEAYERMAKEVVSTATQASAIARRLNDFARKQKVEKHEINIVKCLDKAFEMIEKQYSKLGINIVREYGEVPSTLTDDKLLLQVFLNILRNAQQAMPSGGKITARVNLADGNILASVADTGIGISKENLDKIFTPFYTTKGAFGAGQHHGIGLGLAVSYSIVKGLGGEIKVESIEGRGAKFTVSIPAVSVNTAELAAPSLADLPPTRGGKILVVDDEKPILGLMKTILGAAGYSVETAESGKEALLALEKFKADVVLLDMVLPGTNLEGLLKDLQSRFPEISVIVVTGLGAAEMNNWQTVLNKYGICSVVLKPFDFSRLKLEIDKCLIPRAQ